MVTLLGALDSLRRFVKDIIINVQGSTVQHRSGANETATPFGAARFQTSDNGRADAASGSTFNLGNMLPSDPLGLSANSLTELSSVIPDSDKAPMQEPTLAMLLGLGHGSYYQPATHSPDFLGVLGNWCLFGVLVVQTYVYSYNFPKDRRRLKLLVQTAPTGADVYHWFASGYGDTNRLATSFASAIDVPIMESIVSAMVQFFYTYRV
ncbi:hypothetical protein V8E52_010672 [Russula decolorans]